MAETTVVKRRTLRRFHQTVLTVENAVETLETAQSLGAEVMKNSVMEFITLHFREVVEREEMLTLSPNLLVELLRWKAAMDSN